MGRIVTFFDPRQSPSILTIPLFFLIYFPLALIILVKGYNNLGWITLALFQNFTKKKKCPKSVNAKNAHK